MSQKGGTLPGSQASIFWELSREGALHVHGARKGAPFAHVWSVSRSTAWKSLPSFHSGWCLEIWRPLLDSQPWELWDPEHAEKCLEFAWNLLGSPQSAAAGNQRRQPTSPRSCKQVGKRLESPRDTQVTPYVRTHAYNIKSESSPILSQGSGFDVAHSPAPVYPWINQAEPTVHHLVDTTVPFISGFPLQIRGTVL